MAGAGDPDPVPPAGEWNADQILAHVAIVTATTIATVSAVASGTSATYDNRIALDTWTIERLVARAGGNAGLRDRIRLQGDSLCALGGPALSEAELGTLVPTLLLSDGAVLVDQLVPLRELVTGLADVELPAPRPSAPVPAAGRRPDRSHGVTSRRSTPEPTPNPTGRWR